MKKVEVIRTILGERYGAKPLHEASKAFAPSNIALCKYWGKRDNELNLPITPSLSIALADKGAIVEMQCHTEEQDTIFLNGQPQVLDARFAKRLIAFLNLFRSEQRISFHLNITSHIPIAAGLASSAAGFASIVQALNLLYGWELTQRELSILARLGSGSACRSIWPGFVEWHVGIREDGMDSHGDPLSLTWPGFCVGLVIFNEQEKTISSRDAMQRTIATSVLYSAWPAKVNQDLSVIRQAIKDKNFESVGRAAESNACTMHATMLSAWPPVSYFKPETVINMQKVWQLREEGLEIYFTQDAGPNLKLLFLEKDEEVVRSHFYNVEVVRPFG